MMKYKLEYLPKAEEDILKHKKAGDKIVLKQIDRLLDEIEVHPTYGIGHPERLKHRKGEVWSREITKKHRLVYEIFEDRVVVEVVQARGHYNDK